MNNLSALLNDLGLKLGLELVAEENGTGDTNPFSIRFASLDKKNSFKLNISRSWKTTQVSFVADSFAGEVVHFLCSEIYKNSNQIYSLIEANQSIYSSIRLEIDGSAFFGKPESLSANPTFIFEIEVMTPESSISYGLLNTQEVKLCEFAITLFAALLPKAELAYSNPDEVIGFPEGAVSRVEVNKYERDPRNRREAIAIHGKTCLACDFNFNEKYGELGEDYIVVHHVVPVSQIGPDYKIDPSKDLVTICANCHAMVHRQNPPLSVEELRKILRS